MPSTAYTMPTAGSTGADADAHMAMAACLSPSHTASPCPQQEDNYSAAKRSGSMPRRVPAAHAASSTLAQPLNTRLLF